MHVAKPLEDWVGQRGLYGFETIPCLLRGQRLWDGALLIYMFAPRAVRPAIACFAEGPGPMVGGPPPHLPPSLTPPCTCGGGCCWRRWRRRCWEASPRRDHRPGGIAGGHDARPRAILLHLWQAPA